MDEWIDAWWHRCEMNEREFVTMRCECAAQSASKSEALWMRMKTDITSKTITRSAHRMGSFQPGEPFGFLHRREGRAIVRIGAREGKGNKTIGNRAVSANSGRPAPQIV